MMKNDPLGAALYSYLKEPGRQEVIVHSDICDDDVIPVSYLVRSFGEMPDLERTALSLCKGQVLDVGACAGCHTRYLMNRNFDVTAIDISKGAIFYMKRKGIVNTHQIDFKQCSGTFDTILLLMNGVGLIEDIANFPVFIAKCKSMLRNGGQVLFDSSDLKYLYAGDLRPDTKEYYGHVQYQMEFAEHKSDWFQWLYLDIQTLLSLCKEARVRCEILKMGPSCDYLARLTFQESEQ